MIEVGELLWLRSSYVQSMGLTSPHGSSQHQLKSVPSEIFHDDVWLPVVLKRKTRNVFVFESAKGGEIEIRYPSEDLEEDANIKRRNVDTNFDGDNLVDLYVLNEPEILIYLKKRFESRLVYTYTGPVLIAINPSSMFVPDNSCEKLFTAFIRNIIDEALAIQLETLAVNDKAQTVLKYSILISGESGSGKTECSKLLLRQLIHRFDYDVMSARSPESRYSVSPVPNRLRRSESISRGLSMQESLVGTILEAGKAIEAFAHAKTLHTYNSSRFGKYTNVHINANGLICDANIQTFLLENVRVVNQHQGERNFHIFYYFMAGITEEERKKYKLGRAEEYHYINQGHVYNIAPRQDANNFQELVDALTELNFSQEELEALFSALAGLLHLGEIKFRSAFKDSLEFSEFVEATIEGETLCEIVSRLCQFSVADLRKTLVTREFYSPRGEVFVSQLMPLMATNARDAIAKIMYKRVFDWLVVKINSEIRKRLNESAPDRYGEITLGILDIFGFDAFKVNSFEQLCINYANETMQQQFNQHMFKFEMEEYEKEGIIFTPVAFTDNQQSLEVIHSGVFHTLDDVCKLPDPNDKKFAQQLYKECGHFSHFKATKPQQAELHFTIVHFAGEANYAAHGFVARNMDELPQGAIALIDGSKNMILCAESGGGGSLPSPPPQVGNVRRSSVKRHAPSAATQFRNELMNLIKHVNNSIPHYVRCINPIDRMKLSNKPQQTNAASSAGGLKLENDNFEFDQRCIADQLRYGGIVEGIQISRSGFPTRLRHVEFFKRYKMLASYKYEITKAVIDAPLAENEDILPKCKALLEVLTMQALEDKPMFGPDYRSTVGEVFILGGREIQSSKLRTLIEPQQVQVGVTKVFLQRAGHELLEFYRQHSILCCRELIIRLFRRNMMKKRNKVLYRAVIRIQRMMKAYFVRNPIKRQLAVSAPMTMTTTATTTTANNETIEDVSNAGKSQSQSALSIEVNALSPTPSVLSMTDETGDSVPTFVKELAVKAKVSRAQRNFAAKIAEYKKLDEQLLAGINGLIAAKRQADEDALLRTDVLKSKKLLNEWASLFQGTVKSKIIDLAQQLDYGYNLLLPEKLIPVSMIGRAFTFSRSNEQRLQAAKAANKSVTKEHKVFKGIFKLMELIRELIELCDSERKKLEERMRKAALRQPRLMQTTIENLKKIGAFSRVLYNYYYQYVLCTVKEFGDGSAYKAGFADEVAYICAFTELIEAKQPLLSVEKVMDIGGADKDGMFPLTLSRASLRKHAGPDVTPVAQKKNNVVFKLVKYGAGLEFMMNCLFALMRREFLMYPIRFIKLIGRSAANHGEVAYYQASMRFSEDTLINILANYKAERIGDLLDSASYSIAVIISLALGVTYCDASNLMVEALGNEAKPGPLHYCIMGFNTDVLLCQDLFSEKAKLNSEPDESPFAKNILFSLPLAEQKIDETLVRWFLSNKIVAEELMTSWMRELYLQNKRYESLVSSGFTTQDLLSLQIPILLPNYAAIHVYERLKKIIECLENNPHLTHRELLAALFPSVAAEKLAISVPIEASSPQDPAKDAAVVTNSDKIQVNHLIQALKDTLRDGYVPTRFCVPIEDCAVEFLTIVDFSVFKSEAEILSCGNLSDSLSFLPSLYLYLVTEEQLVVMFGGLVESGYRALAMAKGQKALAETPTAQKVSSPEGNESPLPTPSRLQGKLGRKLSFGGKLFTEHIYIIGHTPENQATLERCVIIDQIQRVLGIQVTFWAELPKSKSSKELEKHDPQLNFVFDDANNALDQPFRSNFQSILYKLLHHSALSTHTLDMAVQMTKQLFQLSKKEDQASDTQNSDILDAQLFHAFSLLIIHEPSLIELALELINNNIFPVQSNYLHILLMQSSLQTYELLIVSVVKAHPEFLFQRFADDNLLPCDRLLVEFPDTDAFKHLLCAHLCNCLTHSYAITPELIELLLQGELNAVEDAPAAQHPLPFSAVSHEQELIIMAVRYGLPAQPIELQNRQYFLRKSILLKIQEAPAAQEPVIESPVKKAERTMLNATSPLPPKSLVPRSLFASYIAQQNNQWEMNIFHCVLLLDRLLPRTFQRALQENQRAKDALLTVLQARLGQKELEGEQLQVLVAELQRFNDQLTDVAAAKGLSLFDDSLLDRLQQLTSV